MVAAPYSAHRIDDASVLRQYGHVVRRVALALGARCGIDPDELWSAGALGLLEAVKRYDASRGVPLEAYVRHRVRGAMLDELRRLDRLPRRLRMKISAVDRARAHLTNQLGRAPTRDELAHELDMAATDIDALEEARERPMNVDEAAPQADESFQIDALLVSQDRAHELKRAIAQLPERLQHVLAFRYVEELTLKEIAGMLGVSEPRVCQLHNAAIEKLRRALATQ